MASNWPILSLLIWLPIFGGLAILAAGEQRAGLARLLALVTTVVTFALSVVLYAGFDTSTAAMQFVELKPWIETFSIQYHLGIDGLSIPMVASSPSANGSKRVRREPRSRSPSIDDEADSDLTPTGKKAAFDSTTRFLWRRSGSSRRSSMTTTRSLARRRRVGWLRSPPPTWS